MTTVTATRRKREKHSSYIDVDVMVWLRSRAVAEDRTVDYLIRDILRSAFAVEQPAERRAS